MTGVFVYFLGAALGAPTAVLSPFFSVFMAPVPFVGWWAYVRAPPELRRFFLILAWAATFWLIGSVVWYGYYFAGGSTIPEPPGLWDGPLLVARLLVIAAVVVAMRSLISFRIAILDVWAICAATFALGAAFVWRGLEDGVSAGSLVTLNRPHPRHRHAGPAHLGRAWIVAGPAAVGRPRRARRGRPHDREPDLQLPGDRGRVRG